MINVVRDWIFPIVFGGVVLFGLWAVVMAFIVARRQQRAGLTGQYRSRVQASAAAFAAGSEKRASDEELSSQIDELNGEGSAHWDLIHNRKIGLSGRFLFPGEIEAPPTILDPMDTVRQDFGY